MTTFETAKVDDKVFDIKHGWGLISKVFPKKHETNNCSVFKI